MSGPGGAGGMKRVRLLQSLKQSKASSSQAGKKTSITHTQDELEVRPESNSQSNRQQILIQILTPKAMARLFQIALGSPEMAKRIENDMIYAVHKGQIIGKVSEDRLISCLEQIKAQTTTKGIKLRNANNADVGKETTMMPKQDMLETSYTQDCSKFLGLKSSKKRIFGSPFCRAQSPVTDSYRYVKSPGISSKAGVEASIDENTKNASKNHQKQGRGPASGQKLDQQVKKHGKYKIWFLPGETDAVKFNMDLSNGIGIIIRTNAEIKGATRWDDVTEDSKAVCYTRLFKKSRVNSENRKKKPFNHTSGKRTMLSHYKEMTEKSEIELFRKTHVSKSRGGKFISIAAQSKYNEMVDLKNKASEQGKEALAEQVIVKSVLGHRSGYIKGMGHGVQVPRNSESNLFAGIDLKEKLLELETAKAEIINLTNVHIEQSKKMDKIESKIAKMLEILQHIPGIPPELFHDDCCQ